MKLHIKKIISLSITCLLAISAMGQKTKLDTAVLAKDWAYDGNGSIDLKKATPQQLAVIKCWSMIPVG